MYTIVNANIYTGLILCSQSILHKNYITDIVLRNNHITRSDQSSGKKHNVTLNIMITFAKRVDLFPD